MDRKAKKRLKVLRQKMEKLRLQLAGAKEQSDEPGEVARREAEIAAVQQEIRELKKA